MTNITWRLRDCKNTQWLLLRIKFINLHNPLDTGAYVSISDDIFVWKHCFTYQCNCLLFTVCKKYVLFRRPIIVGEIIIVINVLSIRLISKISKFG